MNILTRLLTVIVFILVLSACQSDHEQTKVQVTPQTSGQQLEKVVVDEKKEIEPKTEQVTDTQKAQSSVDLSVSDQFLKQIDVEEEASLSEPPPQIGKEETKKRKVKISGEVLLDTDKEAIVDKVDGGKVNISIPLD